MQQDNDERNLMGVVDKDTKTQRYTTTDDYDDDSWRIESTKGTLKGMYVLLSIFTPFCTLIAILLALETENMKNVIIPLIPIFQILGMIIIYAIQLTVLRNRFKSKTDTPPTTTTPSQPEDTFGVID